MRDADDPHCDVTTSPEPSPHFRVRSQLTNHEVLTRLAIDDAGDLLLAADASSYEPAIATARPAYTYAVRAIELDAADGFLVGENGLIVHLEKQPAVLGGGSCTIPY